jgi:hypothetical protein
VLLHDVLRFRSVAAGRGWLIFAMPPAEAGIHLLEGEFSKPRAGSQLMRAALNSMCDDRDAQIEFREGRNVQCTGTQAAPWGRTTTIPLPSGGHIGLYQPLHTTAFDLN